MQQEIATPVDLKVLMNHIYEYKKGVRRHNCSTPSTKEI